MTEDEAKAKWCPFARTVEAWPTGPTAPRNRVVKSSDDEQTLLEGLVGVQCVASACMAWRWSEAKRTAAFLEAVQAHMQASAKPNFNTAVQAVYAETGGKFERVEGYCGLAGSPQ